MKDIYYEMKIEILVLNYWIYIARNILSKMVIREEKNKFESGWNLLNVLLNENACKISFDKNDDRDDQNKHSSTESDPYHRYI